MIEFLSFSLSYTALSMLFFSAFLIGMAKTGVSGTTLFAVPIMAMIFGGKASSGLLLPLLIMADLFAVYYYHRHANWQYLLKLFPSAAVGVMVGTWLGNEIDDELFKQVMGIIIFVSLAIMLWMERANKEAIPNYLWFAVLMGLLGGITTMVGNLAGSIMALYLLSMRLPKNQYIGTAAWFFLIINLFKVPFHVFSWHTISVDSFLLNLLGLPFIALGAYAGMAIVKRLQEQQYRYLVIGMTAVAALLMVV